MRQGFGEALVIHGPPDGDADAEGRPIDCTQYIADMRESPREEIDAAHIVKCVNGYAWIAANRNLLDDAARIVDASALATPARRAEIVRVLRQLACGASAPEARESGTSSADGALTATGEIK